MTPKDPLDRRDFLKRASVVGLGALAAGRGAQPLFALEGSPAERLNVAVMGLNGRGMVHAHAFAAGKKTSLGDLWGVGTQGFFKGLGDEVKLQTPPTQTVTAFCPVPYDKKGDAPVTAPPV